MSIPSCCWDQSEWERLWITTSPLIRIISLVKMREKEPRALSLQQVNSKTQKLTFCIALCLKTCLKVSAAQQPLNLFFWAVPVGVCSLSSHYRLRQVEKANIDGVAGSALCLADSLPVNIDPYNLAIECMARFSHHCRERLLQPEQPCDSRRRHDDMWNYQTRVGLASLLFYTSAVTHGLCVCVRNSSFYNRSFTPPCCY